MSASELPVERFPALTDLADVVHCFITRVPGIDVGHEKTEALRRLDRIHREVRESLGLGEMPFLTAEQIHGNEIALVRETKPASQCFAGCDGLITDRPKVCLGIYVADCCAVFLVDPVRRAIGLVHSGKKGTGLGITRNAIAQMQEHFGSAPNDLIVQLSPCIRPPNYEIDFAAEIVGSCERLGVGQVVDSGVCTASDLEHYYSYRAEKGKTGRMLALLALR